MTSEALKALYEGDQERAEELLGPDESLSVFDAAAFGRTARLESIIDDDASQANEYSDDGFTPLHLAVFGRQEAAVRLLIERGADVGAVSGGSIAQVPPLGTAAFVGSVPLAQLLIDAGADVNAKAEGGFTALHSAAQSGNGELVRLLLERGADPEIATVEGKRAIDFAPDDETRTLLE